MDLKLADKVVWVTGASGGIGRSIAEEFANEGARVALHTHRRRDELEAWLAQQSWRERSLVVQADVRRCDELEQAAQAILQRFGRLDACICNAGVWPSEDRLLNQLEPARLEDTVRVNLLGALFTARAFLGVLAQTGARTDGAGTSITFIGSTAGRFGERFHADYAAAKAGLVGAVASLKNEIVELDPFGRVNLIEPGWTVTRMARATLDAPGAIERAVQTMPLRQLGRAVDIARTALWLSSPVAASHITGQTVTVAGGMEGRVLWESDVPERQAILDRLQRD